jgi:hypothetical protein
MPSKLFTEAYRHSVEDSILTLLLNEPYFLTDATASSPRAAGDAIQSILSEKLLATLGDSVSDYSATFARRAMADIAFKDSEGFYYVVDVKTHRINTAFNMPNLISVERLTRFYEDDANYFTILLVNYEFSPGALQFQSVRFIPIEYLSWDCLTVGALGWGQIQIVNANKITLLEGQSRRRWMLDLCDVMLSFYPREISKIGERLSYFERVKHDWEVRAG